MTKPNYPAGITCMDDYRGAMVRLVRDVTTRGGSTYRAGEEFLVVQHYRGRLVLGLIHWWGKGNTVMRQIERRDVEIVKLREQKAATP